MTFLQPLLLIGLPLVTLPILIHLINQRRYQTVQWRSAHDVLARRQPDVASGYAKLRQMLILLFRVLAIAGLIFAVSRPLAGGWLGRATGGRPDTTIILIDRSPSMQQQGPGTVISKLEAGRQQLGANVGSAWLGQLGIDRKHDERRTHDRVSARAGSVSLATELAPAARRTCRPCWRRPATTYAPTVAAAPKSGFAPICVTTTGTLTAR